MIIVNFHKKFGEDPCSHTCVPGVSACTHILTDVRPLTPHVLLCLLLLLLGGKVVVESKNCQAKSDPKYRNFPKGSVFYS